MKVRSSMRLESFGGTLFDLRSGKRVYVNQEETQKIVPYAYVLLEDCSFAAPLENQRQNFRELVKFINGRQKQYIRQNGGNEL